MIALLLALATANPVPWSSADGERGFSFPVVDPDDKDPIAAQLGVRPIVKVNGRSMLCMAEMKAAIEALGRGATTVTVREQDRSTSEIELSSDNAKSLSKALAALLEKRRDDIRSNAFTMKATSGGVEVAQLCPESAIAPLGLQPGDVLLMKDHAAAVDAVAALADDPTPSLVVQRKGAPIKIATKGKESAVHALLSGAAHRLAPLPPKLKEAAAISGPMPFKAPHPDVKGVDAFEGGARIGFKVMTVINTSPLVKNGLRRGDIVIGKDDAQVNAAFAALASGKKISVKRQGKTVDVP